MDNDSSETRKFLKKGQGRGKMLLNFFLNDVNQFIGHDY